MSELEKAWDWREKRGILAENEAVRVFHGPGEGSGPLRQLAIDRFGSHFWVTQWESVQKGASTSGRENVIEFLREKNALSAVALWRPEKGIPSEPQVLFGSPPENGLTVRENGARYRVRFRETRHPGLFLDHAPLREWLKRRSRSWKVLNTFAYTGSLSIAAGLGGADHVTTLDLSRSTVEWARDNWALNELPESNAEFIAGDFFEWLPRFERSKRRFDCIILDPPSFSRGKKGNFSTAKDLKALHELAMRCLAPHGVLATSINSANVTWAKFEGDVASAARATGLSFEELWRIDLPETFPTRIGNLNDRYLKGWVLKS